ncbi:DUF6077 domain-containing protein [Terrabacter sp. NPDC080008]|uniref:DUF6077 domain-containing protein n=1 Tax=Terrabacter sp. NPDC080008 TaxID=3155176 RepID=UPI00344D1AEC
MSLTSATLRARRAVDRPPESLLGTVTRAVLIGAIVFFGAWTLVYQAALFADAGVVAAAAAAAVVGAVLLVAVAPVLRPMPEVGRSGASLGHAGDLDETPVALLTPATRAVAVGTSAVTVVVTTLGRPALAVAFLAVGSLTWLVLAARARRRTGAQKPADRPSEAASAPSRGPSAGGDSLLWLTGWFWALACGVISAIGVRHDGDDAYFVNLAQWVSQRGDFPMRETMLTDEVLPALDGHRPPIHSLEGLVGAVGYLTGQSGAALTYVVSAPLFTVGAVLVMTWLVSVCRIPFGPLALSAAVLYLLMSGSSGASFGNFFALRMWQGKSVLAALALPLVVALSIELLRHGGWRRGVVLALAVVSAVGFSNTAVFLLPVLLGALTLAGLVLGQLRQAVVIAATLAYPLAWGLIVALSAPPPSVPAAADATPAAFLDPLTGVPGGKGLAVATYLGLCLGWLGLRSHVARVAALSTVLAMTVVLLPPVTHLLTQAAGLGPVLWRMWWVVPVPVLVGAVVGVSADLVHGRTRVVVATGVGLAVGLLPLLGGQWIGSPGNGTRWASPTAWKVPPGAEEGARLALQVSNPGDVVLAPWATSRVLAGMSVDMHPASARTFYLSQYLSEPGSYARERLALQTFADRATPPDPETLRPMLEALGVDTACVAPSRGAAVRALERMGFRTVATQGELACLRRA